VREVLLLTVEGNVDVLPCEAALPEGEQLSTGDADIIKDLQIARWNFADAEAHPKFKSGISLSAEGFLISVLDVCSRHPKIVILPVSGGNQLASCKNMPVINANAITKAMELANFLDGAKGNN
jgi:hypothetical protein